MRKLYLFFCSLLCSDFLWSQTTVFTDDFNSSHGANYTVAANPLPVAIGTSSNWSLLGFPDFGGRIHSGVLDLTNDASAAVNSFGFAYAHTLVSSFTSPFNPVLNSNAGIVTWTFNMRQLRTDPGGFTIGSYGVGFILGATPAFTGYAVLLGEAGTTDPVRLVRFNGTVGSFTNIITSNTPGLGDFGDEYLSVKVTYTPATNTWELFLRNDGLTAFADPVTGTLVSQGTAVDATYTNTPLVNFGGYWQGGTLADQTAFFDNVTVTIDAPATLTIITGTVSAPPFLLPDCSSTVLGSVTYSYTGTANGGNFFSAQLSDDIGSFASAVTVGSVAQSGTDPGSLVIPVIIPAGTATGTGYRIRVVGSSPAVIGSSSAAFTIVQSGLGGCSSSHTDYYRSIQTGDWANLSTWQSSADAINWVPATLTPTSLANTISIRNATIVTLSSSIAADQVVIDFNGELVNNMAASNTFLITDGPGDDIDIQNGGSYKVTSGNGYAGYQTMSVGATTHIRTGGVISIGSGGLLPGSNHNTFAITPAIFIWENGSIFDWNTTSIPGTNGVTYFPDATAFITPVWRFTVGPGPAMGGGTALLVKGILEANSAVTFDGSSDKTIRNGIHGFANVTMNAGGGQLIVNGQVASFSGAGIITPNSLGLLLGPNSASTLAVLLSAKTINGDIVFNPLSSSVNVFVGGNNLTVSGSILNGSSNNYVQTNSSGGTLILKNITTSKTFPIGETTYNPLTIASTSGNDFAARVRTGIFDPNGAIPTDAVNRTWYIHSPSGITPNVTATYQYSNNPGELSGTASIQPNSMELLQSDFAIWHLSAGNTAITSTAGPPFTVTTAVPLTINNTPVPYALGVTGTVILASDFFITARAGKRNGNGEISWKVAETAGIMNFELQRSVNNGIYETIATIIPINSQFNYNYIDTRLQQGLNLYRIRVNRFTSGARFSNIVAVLAGGSGLLITAIAPNPIHTDALLTINVAGPITANFTLFNINGAAIKHWSNALSEGTNTLNLSMGELSPGVYLLMATAAGEKTFFRLVKL